MAFVKNFLINLGLLAGLGVIIYLIEPEMVWNVLETTSSLYFR